MIHLHTFICSQENPIQKTEPIILAKNVVLDIQGFVNQNISLRTLNNLF